MEMIANLSQSHYHSEIIDAALAALHEKNAAYERLYAAEAYIKFNPNCPDSWREKHKQLGRSYATRLKEWRRAYSKLLKMYRAQRSGATDL